MKKRNRKSPVWQIGREELIELVGRSNSLCEVLAHFGLANKGGNYYTLIARFQEDGIDYSKCKGKFGQGLQRPLIPLEDILVENSSYNRTNLKQRLLKVGLLENSCSKCGLGPNWNGEKLVMVIDHKNGVSNDNRLENLRLLCPNCNSQTPTFAGRNSRQFCSCGKCGRQIRKRSSAGSRRKLCDACFQKSRFGPKPDRRKVIRPSANELATMLWEKPTTWIAKEFGVSDNAVSKWVKSYGLKKPPRGYWGFKSDVNSHYHQICQPSKIAENRSYQG